MIEPNTTGGKCAEETLILLDSVRASKAGHAFHEAWEARSALDFSYHQLTCHRLRLKVLIKQTSKT